jgi:methyltransferase
MKLVHFTWFIAMACEVIFLKRLFIPRLSGIALLFTALGQGLRYSAIRSLDRRWSVRIITLPGSKPVTTGIYKYIRHPNYLGVTLEIFGVPLLHSAYITSLIWSFANLVILRIRIPREERALDEAA